jgi:hypothetical protein
MRRAAARTPALVAAAALAFLVPAAAQASAVRDAALARRGLAHAQKRHWLKAQDVQAYRATVSRALRDVRTLPTLRAQIVEAQLAQLTPLWDSYVRPRALALFTQLAANLDYLETHRLPAVRTDITGDDDVVYRWFPGRGFEFHPLASFSALLNDAAAKDTGTTQTLADALLARAIPRGSRLLWEYSFPYGIGRPPWASGMAEAVAAQALARAGALLEQPLYTAAAAKAFAAVPPLLMQVGGGPWIRLYGFNDEIVLNAQLQTALSLIEYAATTGDARADDLADGLLANAQALFPRFDTGDWSLYELGGGYASRDYETFVTTLLAKLATKTQEPFWNAAAQRFRAYLYDPPQVVQTAPPQPVWPQPQDGFLDTGTISITLSMRSSVAVAVAGKVTTYRLSAGPHVLTWKPPPGLAPGTYPVQLSAVSYAGNRRTYPLAPFVVQWDTQPPPLTAQLAGTTLTWSSTDAGTPWLSLSVQLVDPTGVAAPQTLLLGHEPLAGSTQLAPPPGTWDATLSATNSAGQTTTSALGTITG